MAFRGGFGGGRGRGRFGGGPYVPQARGEDGQVVFAKKLDGPPPLFPKLENLPELPTITKRDEEQVARRRRLETFWNASPYYIEKPKQKSKGVVAELENYSDNYNLNLRAKRPPLVSVLKLVPTYFPAELLDQKRGRDGQYKGTSQWTVEATSAKNDLQRLEKLAAMEKRSAEASEAKEGKEGDEKKAGEGDDEEQEDELDEDEEELGEDDYAQNFGFDDDDDYLDNDDGGDDEGPVF